MRIRVIIADDHAIIREGLKGLLEKRGIAVSAIAKNGREAIESAILHDPDIVIMDIAMPDLNGMEATASIRRNAPHIKVIGLSMHSGKNIIDKMFSAGASGYILKDSAFEELYDAIQEVMKGNFYLTPSIARMYIDSEENTFQKAEDIKVSKKLSNKEREVLQLVAEGLKTRDIAERLNLSSKTVESHRRNLMKKLSIFTVAGLTRFAIQEGIIAVE